ncbi:MAG: DNA integrity scanning protein DisA nucleotide-binding domain protein, partial [Desulfococcaceae bacterium]
PGLKNHKHIRKLLLSVENADRFLVSDAKTIIGVAAGDLPPGSVVADFRGGHGFLRLDDVLVCSFFDGRFHSTTRKAKLVQVEEALLETELVDGDAAALFKIIAGIVHHAQEERFGCTLIVDLSRPPIGTAGQHLEEPLDLRNPELLDLAQSLSRVDGALHIGADLRLHGFACLLDGLAVAGEDRSRGARYNSALRFTARHPDLLAVVVSADRPVSVIQGGVELTAQCEWKPVYGYMDTPPLLAECVG